MTYRVIEVLDGNRAIVSTRGLRRVVKQSTGEVLDELLTKSDAKLYADTYNACVRSKDARIVAYRVED